MYQKQPPFSFHTTLAPEEFKNAALFLRTAWPTTHTNPSQNGAFRKRSSNLIIRNLKTLALRFSVEGKHFENGRGFSTGVTTISSKHKSKMNADNCCVFKFLWRSVHGKHPGGYYQKNWVRVCDPLPKSLPYL